MVVANLEVLTPVTAVTLSPLALTAPPLAVALRCTFVGEVEPLVTSSTYFNLPVPVAAFAVKVTVGCVVTFTPVNTVF